MRYHLTPLRMANIKNPRNNKCWQECWQEEKGTSCTAVGMQTGIALLEDSVELPQKGKTLFHMAPSLVFL